MTNPIPKTIFSSWFIKFLDCLFVAIALFDAYDSMVAFLLVSLFPQMTILFFGWISPVLKIVGLVFAIGYPIYWQRKESRNATDSGLRHAWFRGVLRFWLALEICNYGFAKILGTQFGHVYSRADSLVGSLNGLDLTWNYFEHSYATSVIIGLIQIGGSILLLFRRTTLAGAAVLLPVMVNIVMIDIFYGIPPGALMNAILFTLGLCYLLLLRWKDICAVFLKVPSGITPIRSGYTKNLLRLFVIIYAFLFIYHFSNLKSSKNLTGRWHVEQMIRNGDTLKANAWLTDPGAWKNIYLEENGTMTISSNPFVVEAKRSQRGRYQYNDSIHEMKLILWEDHGDCDTINASVSANDSKHMLWKILDNKNTLFLKLSRQ